MSRIIDFIKRHWQIILIVILLFFLLRQRSVTPYNTTSLPTLYGNVGSPASIKISSPLSRVSDAIPQREAAPTTNVTNRLVIQNSNLSLLVNNVKEIRNNVVKKAEELGGYMVDSNINSPEGIDSATVTVRVPDKKLNDALDYYRSLAVRVVSENLTGTDVTDQFVDIQARLDTLNKTKAKFEEILNRAATVTELLEVNRELINIQEQIDSLKGQQQYLEKNSQMVKITIYLSTDELSLPYAPAQPWRPDVIFKTAVRSLVATIRQIGTAVIWIIVYSIVWVPVLGIYWLIKKRNRPQ